MNKDENHFSIVKKKVHLVILLIFSLFAESIRSLGGLLRSARSRISAGLPREPIQRNNSNLRVCTNSGARLPPIAKR
jgi:hypothetical protein